MREDVDRMYEQFEAAEETVKKLRQSIKSKIADWREWAELSDTPESKDASECVLVCAEELENILGEES